MSPEIKTFRGLSLAEVEAKVRAELGDDAVVVRQREGLSGGVGGFFQRRLYEVDAMAGEGGSVEPAPAPEPTEAPAVSSPEVREDFMSQLKAALGPELEQAAAEQQAVREAADFVPESFAMPAGPPPAPAPLPAPNGSGAALAALFAPDAPKAPVAWPDE